MTEQREDIEVIEYIPKKQSGLFKPWIVVGLLLAWIAVLVAALFLKTTMLRSVLPLLMLVLLIYLFVCTIAALRRK